MSLEVGDLWKTRGGWTARIIAKIKNDHPLVVKHIHPAGLSDEHVECHQMDGSFHIGRHDEQCAWDLVQKLEEQ